jgi:hypothetical protein
LQGTDWNVSYLVDGLPQGLKHSEGHHLGGRRWDEQCTVVEQGRCGMIVDGNERGLSSPSQGESSSPQSVTGCRPTEAHRRRRHGHRAHEALVMRGFGSLPTASGGEPPSPPSSRFESRRVGAVALGWKLGRTLEEAGAPTLGC